MKIWQRLAIASVVLGAAGLAHAGDVSRGQELSSTCVACHGADGNSTNPEWPKLAGQGERYLFEQLVAYKEGTRQNALMAGQVADLDEQDMRDLAAFYAAQTPEIGAAHEDLAELGESIYRGGIPDKNVAACIACHGPAGEGIASAGFPRLAGQHATYTALELQKYRDGERDNDPNRMMRDVARNMSDEEIEAVASYLEGLYRRER